MPFLCSEFGVPTIAYLDFGLWPLDFGFWEAKTVIYLVLFRVASWIVFPARSTNARVDIGGHQTKAPSPKPMALNPRPKSQEELWA